MKGKVIAWKGEKGFGFIAAEGRDKQVFFHISSLKKAERAPLVGDSVVFEIAQDSQGRLRATHVLLEENVALAPHSKKKALILTKPLQKDALDYFAYGVLLLLPLIALWLFSNTGALASISIPAGIFLVIALALACRQKKPKNKLYSCAKCRTTASHDARTVQALNRGFIRLYCGQCHQAWLKNKLTSSAPISSNTGGQPGCLRAFLIMAAIPVVAITGMVSGLV